MPDTIQFSTGNQIINRYAADGRKLGTEYFTRVTNLAVPLITGQVISQTYTLNVINQNGIAYIDNKEYNTFNGNSLLTALQRIYNAEGYVENVTATTPNYNYYRRDHLGDNREVWLANTNSTVQRTQYYPSGLPWASNAGDNPGLQERKYNGKEFVEMHGYDTYDIVWRQYYPAIMRFQTPDPEAENDYNLSPYTMCGDNMVLHTDPDGRLFGLDNLAGAFIGGLADYGGQVISNLAQGSDHPFTQNINLVSIGTSMAVGALTSGASAFVKGGATVLASTINNTVSVKTSGSGLKVDVQKNPINIAKNTVIDLAADKLVNGAASKFVGSTLSKVGTTNAGKLNNTAKAFVKGTGNNVTRKTTEAVKKGIKTTAKIAERGAEIGAIGTTNNKREQLKDKTDQK